MAKIILGKRPTSFKHVVKFPMLDGTEGAIECVFKYRTRKEFGAFIDGMFTDSGAAAPTDEKFSMGKLMDSTVEKNADYLLEVLEGWNLDEKLNRDSAAQLCNELPGAAVAIMNEYRTAVLDGRLGN